MPLMWKSVLLLALVGCTTEQSSDSPDVIDLPELTEMSAARQFFDAEVFPILEAKCSGGACHSSAGSGASLGFLASDSARAYEVITASPVVGDYSDAAPIASTKVHHAQYNANELTMIRMWLELEREQRL